MHPRFLFVTAQLGATRIASGEMVAYLNPLLRG
jgi:hypothetical protein